VQLIRRKKREDKAGAATLDLYYASDVHGSDQCWRKFLGAARRFVTAVEELVARRH